MSRPERAQAEPAPAEQDRPAPRRPTLVVAALAALAIAAVAVLIAAAHITPVGHAHAAGGGTVGPITGPTLAPQPTQSVSPERNRNPSVVPYAIVFLVIGVAATVAGIMILVWLVRMALRRRALPTLRGRTPDEFAAPDLVVALEVDSAVDRALSELAAGGPVDDAIIRCSVQLEDSARRAGVPRDPSDTPEEAVGRLLAAGGVRADPLRTLASLYREARFSHHPMTPADAETARAALTSILDDLRQREPEPADGATGAAG